MRSMSLVVDLIDLVTKHKSGELRCPATALILNIDLVISRTFSNLNEVKNLTSRDFFDNFGKGP